MNQNNMAKRLFTAEITVGPATTSTEHEILKALVSIRNWCQVEGCTEQVQIADKAMIAAGLKDIPCFQCDGLGEWDEGPLPARSNAQISPEYRKVICPECNRLGRLPLTS